MRSIQHIFCIKGLLLSASSVLLSCSSLAQGPAVSVYQHCNYGGYKVDLAEGYYDLPQLQALGVVNDDLSSLQVAAGYKVTVYYDTGFGGNSASFQNDDACLYDDGWNDVVSSIRVEKADRELSGNPIFPGWYADPEAIVFDDKYWVYPTYSAPYNDQLHMDAFSSPDLVHWTKHSRVLEKANVSWAWRAMWAPSIIEKEGKYYLFFAANDIQSDNEAGGIGVAVADQPEGPFNDLLGRPLIDKFHNGAQPIDQFVFKDIDGQHYMFYGGWGHCNVVKLNEDFSAIVPHDDGSLYKEVTPEGYVEGSFMFRRNGKYYFMWSEGGWGGPHYRVAYAISDSPTGPFNRIGTILQQDPNIATGAGHHSVIKTPGEDHWYIVYHRRPLGLTDANERVTSIDRMYFDDDGYILPVKITHEGVEAQPIRFSGFTAEYYNGMNFEQHVLTRKEKALEFDWGNGAPVKGVNADQFSVRWTAKLTPRYSEDYTFIIRSDNGRRVWVDGKLIIDRWVDDWNVEYAGQIFLEADKTYDIKVEYFENFGGANAKLEWQSASLPRQILK